MACEIISVRDIVFNKDWLMHTVFTQADVVDRKCTHLLERDRQKDQHDGMIEQK